MVYRNKMVHRTLIKAKRVQGACQFLLVLALCLALGACSKRYSDLPAFSAFPIRDYSNNSVGRFKSSYLAAQLDDGYRSAILGPVGISTFVNVDDLYSTSTFGRVYAEQLMSELAMRGFDVVELRHSDALQFLQNEGEFALSRDIGAVRRERDLSGVLVGTYAVSPDRVYVNARLIDPASSMILSAGSVEMSKDKEIARLLRGGSMPTSMERIPVRHLGLNTYPMMGSPYQRNRMYDMEETMWGGSRQQNDFTYPEPRLESKTEVTPKVAPKNK